MSLHTETVQIDINGYGFDADCEFKYEAGEAEKITGRWEDSCPGSPEEIAPISLMVHFDKKEAPKDMSFLLEYKDINDDIEAQLQEIAEAWEPDCDY